MTTKATIRTPVIPRNKADPTQSARQVGRMFNDIDERYLGIKRDLRALFDMQLTGSVTQTNSQLGYMACNNDEGPATLYQVNIGKYIYDMTARKLANLLQSVQTILDNWLLEGGEQNVWAMGYVQDEYERGTHLAVSNLSVQSSIYEQQVSLADRLSSPAIQNQIASAQVATYSDWKGISDKARADLANVITDSVARGINPRETAAIVSKRLDVSMSAAKNIAQTEQVGALRDAQRTETVWARDSLGINTKMLHLSALKPTSRSWHVARHGHTYTPEEVEAWYAEDGNRYHCYCSQIPVVLDDDGNIVNQGMVEKLTKERLAWLPAEKPRSRSK
ncbi:phage minor head protein [Rouxiella badensis]|uniref:phage minor head protein n=1 Tax=Rouxiella badensis TaxID=1646377 RepID=UPI001B777A88